MKANPNREARGVVIEAEVDKGRGIQATVLVQKGTLKLGPPGAAADDAAEAAAEAGALRSCTFAMLSNMVVSSLR